MNHHQLMIPHVLSSRVQCPFRPRSGKSKIGLNAIQPEPMDRIVKSAGSARWVRQRVVLGVPASAKCVCARRCAPCWLGPDAGVTVALSAGRCGMPGVLPDNNELKLTTPRLPHGHALLRNATRFGCTAGSQLNSGVICSALAGKGGTVRGYLIDQRLTLLGEEKLVLRELQSGVQVSNSHRDGD